MKDRIAQLLLRQLLARNVDRLKPLELLAVRADASVDGQLVVEDLVLLIVLEVVEVAAADREVAVDVLADRDRPLLTVDQFECTVVTDSPVHDVERESFAHGVDHGIPLAVLVDELALVSRTDVEKATESDDTLLSVVLVTGCQLADGDVGEFDLHQCTGQRRMTIRL